MTERDISGARRARATRPWWRPTTPIALLLLGGLFVLALLVPLPTVPSQAQADVVQRVEERLPGWEVVRAQSSWEGAWTVVASCGARQVGFQMVPGHGLPPGDAWLQPENDYSRSRLESVSDHDRYLVWFAEETRPTLSCATELARSSGQRTRRALLD